MSPRSLNPGRWGAAQNADPVPCAACIVLVASPGQSLLIPGPLNGLEILVETTAGPAAVAAATQAVADAGGRPGLVLTSADAPASLEGSATLHRVAVRVSLGGANVSVRASLDESVFRLKTQLVEIRSAAPQALVGIITTTGDWQALVERGYCLVCRFP